mmetsp:Transcript_18453/g.32327  ORF Transcript_18453/g.32327 Transcript_18453/m.32327 type:complete len:218 (-) Transcript_18453:284-937(-)
MASDELLQELVQSRVSDPRCKTKTSMTSTTPGEHRSIEDWLHTKPEKGLRKIITSFPLPQSPTQFGNIGSAGHPETCGKTCRFYFKGECTDLRCRLCHLDHTWIARQPKASRRKARELFIHNKAEFLFEAAEMLEQRAAAKGIANAEEVVELVRRWAAEGQAVESPRLGAQIKDLLRPLAFGTIVSILVRSEQCQMSREVQEAYAQMPCSFPQIHHL